MAQSNIDIAEIAKFAEHSAQWWDVEGPLKTLHDINPLRLDYIDARASLSGKTVLDVGCGGGILTESMAKRGARVTGIDMSQSALDIALLHQHESGTNVEYLLSTPEKIAAERGAQFDVVTCLELLEHVPDPAAIVLACAELLKPDGHLFFSTINRNVKAYLFAILGAEYILKMLPKNTHDFAKFIRPSELAIWARNAHLTVVDITGLSYHIFTREYKLGSDVSVNYLMHLRLRNL